MSENPPAFPSGDFANCEPGYGMTLRDWFAGQALQAVIAMALDDSVSRRGGGPMTESDFAEQSYAFADAMLAERAKGGAA